MRVFRRQRRQPQPFMEWPVFIHGARAALPHVAERDTPLGRWAKGLLGRAYQNVAVVTLANKLVRIAWAVLRRGQRYDHQLVPLTA